MRRQATILLLTLILAGALYAQGSKATIEGTVLDPSGAVVPGAQIIITNTATNTVARSESSNVGRYVVPNLEPGSYVLTAEIKGFKKFERTGISLQVGDRIRLDLPMEVGASDQSVTVTSELPLLRTEDAQTGLVIDNRRISELPQYNRNPLALARLAANVNGFDEQTGENADFRINGGRTAGAEYFIDGMPVTTGRYHDVASSTPSSESIGEFKVVSSGLNAEYGRLSGGVVLVATKSGSNQLHGSVYEFFRNNKLNANTWRANREGKAIAPFHDNIFGLTAGGPVWLPKVYNGKNRSFWFLSYEGLRNHSGSNTDYVAGPTDAEVNGDFSKTMDPAGGGLVNIYDPTTGRIQADGSLLRQPFAGNKLPAERIDPLMQSFYKLYPKSNRQTELMGGRWVNYVGSSTSINRYNKWSGRFDENWSTSHVTHFTTNYFDNTSGTTRSWLLGQDRINATPSESANVEHVWAASPRTIMTARLGVVRPIGKSGSTSANSQVDNSQWAASPTLRKMLGDKSYYPSVWQLEGISDFGGGATNTETETNYSASADLVRIIGKHTFKAGFDHRRYYHNQNQAGGSGLYYWRDQDTNNGNSWMQAGNGYTPAATLLGHIWYAQMAGPSQPASLQKYYGSYMQDDITVSSKLKVNVGMRWDYEPGRTERYKRQVFWDLNYNETIAPDPGWTWDSVRKETGIADLPEPVWIKDGIHGRPVIIGKDKYANMSSSIPNAPFHFGPRVALAYQVAPRTVVRGSYGLIWLTATGNSMLGSAIYNFGWGDNGATNWPASPDNGLTFPATFLDPFPNGQGYSPPFNNLSNDQFKTNMLDSSWWVSNTKKFSIGYEHQVSFNVQHEFGQGTNSWVVELNYSGNLGRDLPVYAGTGETRTPNIQGQIGKYGSTMFNTRVANPFASTLPPGAVRGGDTVVLGTLYAKNPLYTQLTIMGDGLGTVNYNAGYVQVQHRFGRGFSFLSSYTFSKLLQDCGGLTGGFMQGYPQAGKGLGDVYGVAPNDYTHKFLINYSLDLPIGSKRALLGSPQTFAAKVLDKVIGGWTIAGTTLFQSGAPLTVIGSAANWFNLHQLDNSGGERPVFVNHDYNPQVSGKSALIGAPNYQAYFNKGSFRYTQVTANSIEIGDTPTTLNMRGPGFSQFDFALLKKFPLHSESRDLEMRLEAENVLNKMNPGMPNNNIGGGDFGMITNQAGNPRRVMISAKIHF